MKLFIGIAGVAALSLTFVQAADAQSGPQCHKKATYEACVACAKGAGWTNEAAGWCQRRWVGNKKPNR